MADIPAKITLTAEDQASGDIKKVELAIQRLDQEMASAAEIAEKFRTSVSMPVGGEAVAATDSMTASMKKFDEEAQAAAGGLGGFSAAGVLATATGFTLANMAVQAVSAFKDFVTG